MPLDDSRLLGFASVLQAADGLKTLLRVTADEVAAATGYRGTWLGIFDGETQTVRMMSAQHDGPDDLWDRAQVFSLGDVACLSQLLRARRPLVVPDTRDDPAIDPDFARALSLRTMVNVPLWRAEEPFGLLGVGTFDGEDARAPNEEELAYLAGLGSQVMVASARILARRVREAGRELAEVQRSVASRQRLESLGQLAGGVAHSFNNLLTVIVSTTSLMMEEEDDAGRLDDLRAIEDAAERGAKLTKRLLALGQRQQLSLQPTDPNALMRSLVEMIRRVVPADITIDLIPSHGRSWIDVDRGQIEQVLLNLCLNARDAMPSAGRLTLEIEHVVVNGAYVAQHPWAKPGRYVLLSVTDEGVGMPPEVLDRVFEPFFTTKVNGDGLGLGLAASHGIVAQHGGMLHAYSEVGIGTTFKIYLPVSERPASAVGSKIVGVPKGNERVLVADDQDDVRGVIKRVLERAGYVVVAVEDGAEAIRAAEREPFDLLLFDAVMPNVGGREAYERIHAIHPEIPVLFASGYGAEVLTARFLAKIDAPMIGKPFDPDTLLRAVRSTLDAKSKVDGEG